MRFSADVTFGRLHIIPRLPLFLAAHPELTVEEILDDRDVDLIEEGIDVGFRMGMLVDPTMVARKIGQSRRLVLGTPSYFRKAKEPSMPAELADHQAVIFDLCPNRGRSTWSFRSGTTEQTVTLNGTVRTTAAEGLREAVFAGLGLCVASEWMFQPDLGNGRVTQVLPGWTLSSMDLWATFPTGRRASAKARAFAAFLEDQLRQTNFAEQPARRASNRKMQPTVEFGREIGTILTARYLIRLLSDICSDRPEVSRANG